MVLGEGPGAPCPRPSLIGVASFVTLREPNRYGIKTLKTLSCPTKFIYRQPPPLLILKENELVNMASRYWVVSLPVQNSPTSLWNRLQEQISKHSFDTPLYRFNIPNLRVGTLDSLLALSDDLLKSNSFVEGVSHKIRRQIEDLERVSGVESSSLTVDGVPVDSYLTR
ncbi:hypothetical protein Patl1_02568 [Pistacia atlantica]|uniref:Uncharacterized protein n=1 Tax=Pistacia atlantica TaxID=434234 RepID=A0ACC1C7H5_9ROSI|nr:hypothetical protein Patl1_02568 [Pistacia atlantica]